MITEELEKSISVWIAALDDYTIDKLLLKPDPESWSMGQVFMHLIEETRYYMGEIETCLLNGENANGEMIDEAKQTFANNEFPNVRVIGDPLIAAQVPQPVSISQLKTDWQSLKHDILQLAKRATASGSKGKTRHPGLGYFSALEWLQYAEMHLRHHLRQKKRLDETLK